jgi:hypothetical protein
MHASILLRIFFWIFSLVFFQSNFARAERITVTIDWSGVRNLKTVSTSNICVSLGEKREVKRVWEEVSKKLSQSIASLTTSNPDSVSSLAERLDLFLTEAMEHGFTSQVTFTNQQLAGVIILAQLPVSRVEHWDRTFRKVSSSVINSHQRTSFTLEFGENAANRSQFGGQGSGLIQQGLWGRIVFDGLNTTRIAKKLGLNLLSNAEFTIEPRGENVRLDGNIVFSKPVSTRVEPWAIPTNLIREPLASFTAIRGLTAFSLDDEPHISQELLPEQLYVWSGGTIPVQTLFAAPYSRSDRIVPKISAALMRKFNPQLANAGAGTLIIRTNIPNQQSLRWNGIPPFVAPFLTSSQDNLFLVGGVYPSWEGGPPAPSEMFNQLSKTNLVYYDWEITAQRVVAYRNIFNIFRHIFERPRLGTDTASIAALEAITPHLGNTVTEVTFSSEQTLRFIRQGPIGLTGFELNLLAHWIESSRFPELDITLY